MEVVECYMVDRRQEAAAEGYVKEFTRHSNDVLLNLNELRRQNVLTDATLVVGAIQLRAHCAVLVACSGFFYSLYTHRMLLHGHGSETKGQLMTVSLPNTLDPSSVSLLLDFMYTSRLPLTPGSVSGVLAVATYLQMDHVADACQAFMQLQSREKTSVICPPLQLDYRNPVASVSPMGGDLPGPANQPLVPTSRAAGVPAEGRVSLEPGAFPTAPTVLKREPESPLLSTLTPSPNSPACYSCHPNSPAESNTCNLNLKNLTNDTKPSPDPKACNWKKYKYIVLNPLFASASVKEEEPEDLQSHLPITDKMILPANPPAEAWSGEVPGQIDRQGQVSCYEGSGRAPPLGPHPSAESVTFTKREETVSRCANFPKLNPIDQQTPQGQNVMKHKTGYAPYYQSGNIGTVIGTKTACGGDKPYRCNVCGAQFNRPANLKTHSRIHSGEKPYRCDTCGARFVQVAHLRAHVLIHTGEKPYPCHTCGTRFRHLQTLKSHLRIHTGEKPYTCEKCDLHFRHKSQLRLHLRQKHGAVTNTKVRYKVLAQPYQPILQVC